MLLKAGDLSKVYSCLQCCICSQPIHSTSTSPSALPIPRARPYTSKKRKIAHRSYATFRSSKVDFRDNLNWPCQRTKSQIPPTPYEIFEIEHGGVYSKRKFYELVKMYHPDRQAHLGSVRDHPIASISRAECLERYRLVVQAHEILSDPIRRRAYDLSGAGWGEAAVKMHTGSTRAYSMDGSDSPFGNATWEDWEKWYARTSKRQGPQDYGGTYFNPNAFASVVIMLAVISGVLQATRAGQYSGSIEERAAAFTAQTNQFMRDRKQDNTKYSTSGLTGHGWPEDASDKGPSRGSIRHFLERRDPTRYGLKDEEQEHYQQYFAPRPSPVPSLAPDKDVDRV